MPQNYKKPRIPKEELHERNKEVLQKLSLDVSPLTKYTPDELFQLFEEYVKEEGQYEETVTTKNGESLTRIKLNLISVVGFCAYLNVSKYYFHELRRNVQSDKYTYLVDLLDTKIEAHNLKCGGKGDSNSRITQLVMVNKHGYKSRQENVDVNTTASIELSDKELNKLISEQEKSIAKQNAIEAVFEEVEEV